MALIAWAKQVLKEFSSDKVGMLSAAFSYGAIFSVGPLLLVLISIAGFIFGERAIQGKLYNELAGVLGNSTASTLQNVVIHTRKSHKGSLAFIVGIVGLVLGATGITNQLQSSFDIIFNVVPDPKSGIKRTLYVKLKNVILVILGGILITASIMVSAVVIGLGYKVKQHLGIPAVTLELVNTLISMLVFVALIYMIYRTVPDVNIPKKIVLSAALAVSFLFLIGKVILGLIIGRNGTAGAYGAAASLVTLLLWIYYSGEILFLGAEGIKVYGNNRDIIFQPKKFNLNRTTIHINSGKLSGRIVKAWFSGYKKARD